MYMVNHIYVKHVPVNFECLMRADKHTKKSSKKIKLKSLILAQNERWRQA
jgi:hypothetical protein